MRPLLLLAVLATCLGGARAGVVVIANRTATPVPVRLTSTEAAVTDAVLAAGESRPFFSETGLQAVYQTAMGGRTLPLSPDSAYHFVASGTGFGAELRRLGLGPVDRTNEPAPDRAWRLAAGPIGPKGPVRVMLCVDDEEPTRDALWQTRLAQRLAAASAIIERHSGVTLEVDGYGRWVSDNVQRRFAASLTEFERAVDPPPGVLAIGFSSQYQVQRGRRRLGGTRGPFRRHIMLREFSPQVGEQERVELLVHELGHYLGAAHSPEPASVMRPVLGDRPVRLKGYQVRFDPVNTLAIAMLGEEVRRRGVRQLQQISPARRSRLQDIYRTLAESLPGDPAARVLLSRANRLGGATASTTAVGLEGATARVIAAVTWTAERTKAAGDERTDALVRAAAATADAQPAEDARKALLIGLGFGLDDSPALRKHPRTAALASGVETAEMRERRLGALGKPTARGRRDTAQHFAVMATLTAVTGPKEAALWGLSKEAIDAQGGTGYSFADLAANRAGVRFAERVLAGSLPLAGLGKNFRVTDFVPPLEGLEEGLPIGEVIERYGGKGDPRFEAVLDEIDARIDRLPPYALQNLGFE